MGRINGVNKETDNPFLNLYALDATTRAGDTIHYYVASRAKGAQDLRAISHRENPDGVILYGVWGENRDKLVLIRQYRYPLGDYVYEFPAGLVEPGEDITQAGIREMWEETGLTFTPVESKSGSRPFFTSIGMTDESCAMCFGYCTGQPTNVHQEDTEDIQVVLADRNTCRHILREEPVAIMAAYMMMHFIAQSGDPLDFLKEL